MSSLTPDSEPGRIRRVMFKIARQMAHGQIPSKLSQRSFRNRMRFRLVADENVGPKLRNLKDFYCEASK